MKLSNNGRLLIILATQGIIFYIINKKINTMGKVNEEVRAIVAELDEATNKVAAKIDKAISDLEAGTVDESTLQSLRSASVKLKALGKDPETPVPPVIDNDDDDAVVEEGDTEIGSDEAETNAPTSSAEGSVEGESGMNQAKRPRK